MASGLAGGPLLAAPPEPLPAAQLDFRPWGSESPGDSLCRGAYVMPDYRLPPPEPGKVASESTSASYGEDGETLLQGEVVLRRDTAQLETPGVRVPPSRERAFAEGPLALRDQGLLVRGSAGELSLVNDAASVDEAHYVIHDRHLRGDAQRLARLEDGRYRLSSASFTTCDPGDNLWQLVGGDVMLDRESGFGTARHARLEVKDVPVFYWPWVRFPIDDRRHTGFLWPAVGFSTDSLDYAQPFYWNIAPDQDATITPRWISDRGLLLGGQYRYLFAESAVQIEGAWLDSDDGGDSDNPNDAARRFEGEERWYLDYRHAGTLSPRSRYQLRYGAASDGRYFDDFGSDFAEQNTSSMERLAQVDYRGDTWRLDARAQGFQKLDDPLLEQDKPFYRLPSLTAAARWNQQSGFYQQWQSNYSYFWRDIDETELPNNPRFDRESATGSRLHLSPAVGWRFDESWGHLEPRLEWLGTAYELDYGERDTDRDTSLTRSVPVASVDAGLVFERELDLGAVITDRPWSPAPTTPMCRPATRATFPTSTPASAPSPGASYGRRTASPAATGSATSTASPWASSRGCWRTRAAASGSPWGWARRSISRTAVSIWRATPTSYRPTARITTAPLAIVRRWSPMPTGRSPSAGAPAGSGYMTMTWSAPSAPGSTCSTARRKGTR